MSTHPLTNSEDDSANNLASPIIKPAMRTVALSTLLIAVICIMILPVPSWLLDIGVAASFALAILMLVVTLYIEKPLDFSAFPTILLGALILRLALNVASTKLIIGEGHTGTDAAGDVIEGFAMFIMAGNIAIGLVVFCILLIVNFMVINKGATRMAEVGARFALDAMPGKQLAIDSDIASGAITHKTGKERREFEQAETTFFGSLDGTSKFVKGDAIAGLVITIINLIVGLIIGVFTHSMSLGDGFKTYSILTVGDGLVSQIPAVIISLAAAILLARGGTSGTTDTAVGNQLSRYPVALIVVGCLLAVFGLMPGLPMIPFAGLASLLLGLGLIGHLREQKSPPRMVQDTIEESIPNALNNITELLEVDEIKIEFSPELITLVLDPDSGLESRILNIRRHIALEYGIHIPEIHLTDRATLRKSEYIIHILDAKTSQFKICTDKNLVINPNTEISEMKGVAVHEPVFGAPAKWVDSKNAELAVLAGNTVVEPAEIIATHLLDQIKRNLARIFTFSALQSRLDSMSNLDSVDRSNMNRRLIDTLIPEKVSLELLHAITRNLLSEKVSIRNMQLIIESIAEARQASQNFENVYMHVRTRLGPQISSQLADEKDSINVIQLSKSWEDILQQYALGGGDSNQVGLPSDLISKLSSDLAKVISTAKQDDGVVAVACIDNRRTYIRDILNSMGIDVPVISYGELGHSRAMNVVGVVQN